MKDKYGLFFSSLFFFQNTLLTPAYRPTKSSQDRQGLRPSLPLLLPMANSGLLLHNIRKIHSKLRKKVLGGQL